MHTDLRYLWFKTFIPHYLVERLLTHWSFLTGEKYSVVATIHVSHAYIVTIGPVQLPGDQENIKYLVYRKGQATEITCVGQNLKRRRGLTPE